MNLEDITYVVFDLETTGLNANEGKEIIEIGAVRIKNNEVIDEFDELIKPKEMIPNEIEKITGITNSMVQSKRDEESVTRDFISWCGDAVLVAHNANFDLSFIKMAILKYDLPILNYDVIDTLGLSRYLTPYEKYHNLTCLMNRYKIVWDENKHHRASYDALGTSMVLYKMLDALKTKNINNIEQLYDIPKIILNRKKLIVK